MSIEAVRNMTDAERPPLREMADTDRPLLYLIRNYGRGDLSYLGVAIVAKLLATFLSLSDVLIIGLAFDALFNDRAYTLPFFPDAWIPTEPNAQIFFTVGLLFAIKTADIVGNAVSEWGVNIFAHRTLHETRVNAFDAAQRLEMGFFEGRETGDVMSVLNNDVNILEHYLSEGITFNIWVVATFAASVVYMASLNWQLTVVLLLAVPVVVAANGRFAAVLERQKDDIREQLGKLNGRLQTNLAGMDVVKTFTAEDYERDRVEGASERHFDARWHNRRFFVLQRPMNRLIGGTWLAVLLTIGVFWIMNGPPLFFSGELTVGQLIPFLLYVERLADPMRMISRVVEGLKDATAAAKRIVGLEHSDRRIAGEGDVSLGDLDDCQVTYDDIWFAYPGTDDPVLRGVSFQAKVGETVGVVGSTGAGKSTLVKLLLRFYDASDGAVYVDGRNVRDVPVADLRAAIGYVDQDPFLFDDTIRANITYGAPDADEEAVVQAAKEAGAHEFVSKLPDGYDTEVGERGVKLSGGQRQRIAIARAVVGDPPILVFDEATSHVDNETELLIQDNLETLTEDRLTFVVAHRLSTVRNAERILVLDDGELVEEGDHDSLLAEDGIYANLWHVQVGNVEALPEDFKERARAATRSDD